MLLYLPAFLLSTREWSTSPKPCLSTRVLDLFHTLVFLSYYLKHDLNFKITPLLSVIFYYELIPVLSFYMPTFSMFCFTYSTILCFTHFAFSNTAFFQKYFNLCLYSIPNIINLITRIFSLPSLKSTLLREVQGGYYYSGF